MFGYFFRRNQPYFCLFSGSDEFSLKFSLEFSILSIFRFFIVPSGGVCPNFLELRLFCILNFGFYFSSEFSFFRCQSQKWPEGEQVF